MSSKPWEVQKGSSAKRYIGLLSRAYEYAITELYIDVENPVKKIKIDSSARPRNRVLSNEEFEHISCYLPYHIAILAEIAIKTGMRRGELILIKPSDIIDSKLHIRPEITKTGYGISLLGVLECTLHSIRQWTCTNLMNSSSM